MGVTTSLKLRGRLKNWEGGGRNIKNGLTFCDFGDDSSGKIGEILEKLGGGPPLPPYSDAHVFLTRRHSLKIKAILDLETIKIKGFCANFSHLNQ